MLSQIANSEIEFVKVKLDSKGRISIPNFLRKNFYLIENSDLVLGYNLRYNTVILILPDPANGQDGVARSIEARGASGPGANAAAGAGVSSRAVNPGPDPTKNKFRAVDLSIRSAKNKK